MLNLGRKHFTFESLRSCEQSRKNTELLTAIKTVSMAFLELAHITMRQSGAWYSGENLLFANMSEN